MRQQGAGIAEFGEWHEFTIGEIADVVGGGTPSTKQPDNFDGDIPWLTPKDLSGAHDRYIERGRRSLSQKGLDTSSAKLVPAGTVLLSTRAPIGYVAIAKNPIATNQGFRNLVMRQGFLSEYLYYWLTVNNDRLEQHASGSTFRELSGSALKAIRLHLPPMRDQRRIAHILSVLDDRIELSRRMTETLEDMVRALFRSWFVDFDPVRAKMEGDWQTNKSLPGLPDHLYDLFPDRLMPSQLGPIPRGWRVGSLGDMVELAYGKGLRAQARRPGNVPVYGSNGQVGWHDEKLVDGPGIVVGRKGNPGLVRWSATDFYPIDTTFYVVPRGSNTSLYFLLHVLEEQDLPSIAADSAVPGLNRNLAYMSRQVIPPPRVVEQFDRCVGPLFSTHHRLEEESRTVAAIRDVLLPELVSGDLRVAG